MIPAVLLVLIIVILLIRTGRRAGQNEVPVQQPLDLPDSKLLERHLSQAISFPTVIRENTDWEVFDQLGQWLESAYPLLHAKTSCTILEGYTRVYHWKGKDPSLQPVLCTAHQDVVPPGDSAQWTHPPFSGVIDSGYLWGRGTIDMKVQMIALLDTVEHLIKGGRQPYRDTYIVLGHDEETGGTGALKAAQYFMDLGIRFFLLIDEGGCVSEGVMPGIGKPLATIGIAEKGYVDIELESVAPGGHSSMPARRSSLGILAQVLYTIERRRFPLTMTLVSRQFFSAIRPYMPFIQRCIMSNLWLFKPLLLISVSKFPAGNALVRTTTAVTMASGSDAPNVLPRRSTGTVNFRLLQGYSISDIETFVGRQIGKKPVSFTSMRGEPPSQVTSIDSDAYKLVETTISQVFPDAVIAPYLMTGGTDARKYDSICSGICRFSPYRLNQGEINRMHSVDERISLENIEAGVKFFMQLFMNLDCQITGSR